jgi:hypothetical protein
VLLYVKRALVVPIGIFRAFVFLALLSATSGWSAVATLVPLDATWRFLDTGANQGTNWIASDFSDDTWSSGPAELGYGDHDEATVVNFGNPNNKFITTYFRHSFVVTNTANYSSLILKVIRDDGVAVYLNGREIMRNNLEAAADFATRAILPIEGAAEFTLVTTNVASTFLTNGTNVLAAEIHQVSRGDSDISFALELSGVLNNPPITSLISPTNGARLWAPATVTLTALASDAEGPVNMVEFFEGTNLLGTATSSPFSFNWAGVGAGSYALSAVAVDANGVRGASQVVNITVQSNVAPTVTLIEPTNGSIFVAPATVTILVDASDADGSISYVEFDQGDDAIAQVTNAPYALTTTLPAGNYQFRVFAVDDQGAHSTPIVFTVIVRDRSPPGVSLIEPTNNSVFISPTNVTLVASAADTNGSIAAVEFYADNTLLGTTTNSPYSFVWTNAPLGSHTLKAVAVNDIALRSTSAPVNIVVRDNSVPQVFLDTPTDGSVFEAPADFTVSGTASDPDGSLAAIELVLNGNPVLLPPDSPFAFTATNLPPGEYTLYAVAVDDIGTRATSAVVNVSVQLARLTRGPYLQAGTPNAVTLRWRTDLPTETVVQCGTNVGDYQVVERIGLAETEHEIRLTGLQPGTRYFYSAETSRRALAAGPEYSFVTAPDTNKPTRIWVLGDSGTANINAALVRDAYYSFNGTNDTDLWLMLGDNAYWTGLDTEYQHAVFEMYPEMLQKCVLWTALGNHETYSADENGHFAYLDIFSPPMGGEAGGVPSGTKNYYSFNFANIHFVCLDSMSVDRSSNGVMMTWLREDLAANTNDWLIAFWHHPPYSKGSHDSDWEFELVEMRENALPILEAYGVDLVLCGHSHGYERSFLLDGHYGTADTLVPEMIKDAGDGRVSGTGPYVKDQFGPVPNQGAVYVVAGSSGQVSWGTFDHPAMYISLAELGSLVLDINGNTLDVKFLAYDGTVPDSFTIAKGVSRNVLEITSVTLADNITLKWNAVPGARYQVEKSSSLLAPQWTPISEPMRALTGKMLWSDFQSAFGEASFYRIVRLDD